MAQTSKNKKKPTARENASKKISARGGRAGASPKVPRSEKELSQSRFPGETALTGEDRPRRSQGGKITGQSGGRRPQASGNPRAKGRSSALR
jgi:hypothetical protein